MINLFYTLDKASLEIYNSFQHAKLNVDTVVIEDSGFLPLGMHSPYQFFAGNAVSKSARPKFFNEVEIPDYWEIHGSNHSANVFHLGEIKANIKYHSHPQPRSVHTVEWLDKHGNIRFVDVYNRFGLRFRQDVLNAEGKLVFKTYFNDQHQEMIYENVVTNQIILNWQGKEYVFDSKTKYIQFYLKHSGLDYSVLNINSLGIPFFVSIGLPEGSTNLIWQEHIQHEIPGNMMNMLTQQKQRDYRVLVPDHAEYEKIVALLQDDVKDKVQSFGYVYQFKRQHQMTNNVLIATNSDQLLNFEAIVKACPDYEFHIVAITEMSNTLIQYDQYKNVHLYPKVTKVRFNELFMQSDIYLDINGGNELHNAVRRAFDANMIIYTFKERAHNLSVTLPAHVFMTEQTAELTKQLNHLTNERRETLLLHQREHANHIGINAFRKRILSSK
ncbi:accessory Sec system glycosylation chaperone GtfB [Macrococcus capreoli]|uniref:accessory Sec system glycosylation chaperone GtfB n=1 Tax=Macrococcus capreoli TaxID=2982690 RepID=UPI003EE452CA